MQTTYTARDAGLPYVKNIGTQKNIFLKCTLRGMWSTGH